MEAEPNMTHAFFFKEASSEKLEDAFRLLGHKSISSSYLCCAIEEALERLVKLEKVLAKVDLTKCAPLPWKSELRNCGSAGSGDDIKVCEAKSANKQIIAQKTDRWDFYIPIEKEDGDHDADILAICDSINAVAEAKKILKLEDSIKAGGNACT